MLPTLLSNVDRNTVTLERYKYTNIGIEIHTSKYYWFESQILFHQTKIKINQNSIGLIDSQILNISPMLFC